MHASVTYPYRDRDTFEIHYAGDSVELTAERFAELEAAGGFAPKKATKAQLVELYEAL